ncbi:hypothetical protein HYFRA_00000205 [Hymenoscyphus fraxineus]|uniref:Uncharacterized protein n=1 Tax=Hymenoscyphus fraxineus TaxID=746836 RepID=A0A9N9L0G5_9HELO|nr:hypothetical protein HYFRA_00000205 [Hymenoscyphus fraxineus]
MSARADLLQTQLDAAAIQLKDRKNELENVTAEKNSAWDQVKELQNEIAAGQREIAKLKQQAKRDAEKYAKKKTDYDNLSQTWEDDQIEKERLKGEAERLKAGKAAADAEMRKAKEDAEDSRREYIQLNSDVQSMRETMEEDLRKQQVSQLTREGKTIVSTADFERFKNDSALLSLTTNELEGLKKHLEYYEKNDRAMKFTDDTPRVSDIAALVNQSQRSVGQELTQGITAEGGSQTSPVQLTTTGSQTSPVQLKTTGSQTSPVQPTTTGSQSSPGQLTTTGSQTSPVRFTTTVGGFQSTSPIEPTAATPVSPDTPLSVSSVSSPAQLTTTIGGVQSTSPIQATVGTTTGSIVQSSPGQFTIVIGAQQSIASTPEAQPATVQVTTSETGAQTIRIGMIDGEMQTLISSRIYGSQTDDTIPEEEVVLSKKTIRHHNLVGCLGYTTKDMLIVCRKYSKPLVRRLAVEIRDTFPAIFTKLDAATIKWVDPVNESDKPTPPSLLAIMRNPDIVDMPEVASTILDFASYLCLFIFMIECWLARSWVMNMLESNGLTRDWFANLYTHHHSHGRGLMPAVVSEYWVRAWDQFVLSLIKYWGVELETYALPG